MLFLLSPAKSLDYDTPATVDIATRPQFLDRSAELIALLKPKSIEEIAALMDLSPALAELNRDRYAAWSTRFTTRNSKQAVLAFDGDVYGGLDAKTLGADDMAWAQEHLAILSGLYGVLRPLDRLQPYRLEMGTALANPAGRNLYDFWGDTLSRHIDRRLRGDDNPIVVNLASQEYFKAVARPALKARVVACVFEEWKDGAEGGDGRASGGSGGGQYKIVSFFAKRARGLMARFAIRQRATTPADLHAFTSEGYAFAAGASDDDRLVFRRRQVG